MNSYPIAFGGLFGLQATPLIQVDHKFLGILGKLLKLDELLNLTLHLQNKDDNYLSPGVVKIKMKYY